MLLHGWCCDRSWWTEPGYVDELRSDHRLVNVDIRGAGVSDKPHEARESGSDDPQRSEFAVAASRTRRNVRRECAHGSHRPSVP